MSHHHSKQPKKSSFDALALREVYGIIYSAPEQELAFRCFPNKPTNHY